MTLSREQIKELFPHASQACLEANEAQARSQISNPKPECNQATALGCAEKGKALGMECTTVRLTGYRVRPLDPDNFAGGCKDLIDGLRHAAIIPEDSAWHIRLETEQVKVKTRKEEKTVIRVTHDN